MRQQLTGVVSAVVQACVLGGRGTAPTLTERQIDVLRFASRGLSIPETAAAMFVAEDTVKGYRKQAMARLGSHTMTQAVALALTFGLMPPPQVNS